IRGWRNTGTRVFLAVGSRAQAQRLSLLLEDSGLKTQLKPENEYNWEQWLEEQKDPQVVHIIERPLKESLRFSDEEFIILCEDDLFGQKRARSKAKADGGLEKRAEALNFGDLKTGDFIVHKLHGIGIFEGLKVMPIQG